ncbi:MAG: hypothetical protein AABO41_14995 [Acidobacteriota bacterium]
MMTSEVIEDYNQRLFSGNWRSRIHLSRFYWLARQMRRLQLEGPRIVELGCFDARIIDLLDSPPAYYLGLDANWEGGLDAGKRRWQNRPNVEMKLCRNPDDIPTPAPPFRVGICMETLEHVPPELVEPYLLRLSQVVNGYVFITVPIERGLVFLFKHGAKRLLGMKDDPFSASEFINSVLGRLGRVERREHKGFDDRVLVEAVLKFFDVVSIAGVFPGFPIRSLNLTIGIIAKTKEVMREP